MDDIINHDTSYILQDAEGVKWYFYLTDNKRVGYTTNGKGNWSTHEYIDSQPLKGYAATIDGGGIIRILAYTLTRQLLYYEYLDGNWNSQVIEKVYSRFQDIPYYSIQATATGTHILYYINHSLSRSGESFMHYYLHEGKWLGGRLWKFMSDQVTRFQNLYVDNKNGLHLLFTQRWRQRSHLYYCSYDPFALSWAEPIAIHSSSWPHSYRILFDSSGNLHILWARELEQQYQIRRLFKPVQESQGSWRESLIHEGPHRIMAPLLMEDERNLYCFWKENKSVYKMYSRDWGLNWSAPELIRDSLNYDAALLNFTYLDEGIPKTMEIWGQGYPKVEFAGIGEGLFSVTKQETREAAIELREDPLANLKESVNWIDMKRALASIKRENKSLRDGINNLFSQIDHLNTIIYSLQDQMQVNERSLFNINAQIKQSDFQIKQLQLRLRQDSSKVYIPQDIQYQPVPINSEDKKKDHDHGTPEVKPVEQNVPKKISLGKQKKDSFFGRRQHRSDTKDTLAVELGDQREQDDEGAVKKEAMLDKDIDDSLNQGDHIKRDDKNQDIEQAPEENGKENIQTDLRKSDGDIEGGSKGNEDGRIDKDDTKENGTETGQGNVNEGDNKGIDYMETEDDRGPEEHGDYDIEPGDQEGKKEKDIQRISLGNTIILINPESPEDY